MKPITGHHRPEVYSRLENLIMLQEETAHYPIPSLAKKALFIVRRSSRLSVA
jgi:hypothetical protein